MNSKSAATLDRILPWLLALVTLALFGPVCGHSFLNFDDPAYVTDNPHVRDGLSLDNIRWAFTSGHSGNWHPLTWLSHMLDCQLFGLRPGAHHLTNVLQHTANTLLLFVLLRGMSGALWPSAAVASFFAL